MKPPSGCPPTENATRASQHWRVVDPTEETGQPLLRWANARIASASFAVSFPHLLPPSVSLFDGHGVRIVAKAAMNYLLVNR
jgi:hypothetical protein